MEDAVILSAIRTPIGRYAGSLKDVRPDDLAALVIAEAVRRAHIDADSIEDVILGCANQSGEDNRNVARMALLLAGLPLHVAGQTVNRLCGSGLQAVNSAAQAIQTGLGSCFLRTVFSIANVTELDRISTAIGHDKVVEILRINNTTHGANC